jgi:hypothetical protein
MVVSAPLKVRLLASAYAIRRHGTAATKRTHARAGAAGPAVSRPALGPDPGQDRLPPPCGPDSSGSHRRTGLAAIAGPARRSPDSTMA